MSNSSSITQFLLLALADTRELQLLHFWLSLGIYLAALMANGLIITTIVCDHHLHTPMYFFLLNLSLLDLGSISTIVPKAMATSLWDTRDISSSNFQRGGQPVSGITVSSALVSVKKGMLMMIPFREL